MKKIICLTVSLLALQLAQVFGQPINLNGVQYVPTSPVANSTNLTIFNLDFPGGTPKKLVAAVEEATGKPLNVIIPDEDADIKLPPFKLNGVNFSQLSEALRQSFFRADYIRTSPYGGLQSVSFGSYFRTDDNTPTDNSVWYFFVQKAPTPTPVKKVCQFYSLEPYLKRGLTVDDITTAIQTGWKMSDDNSSPELNYHKETKLLIAYGKPDKLKVIDDVLTALRPPKVPIPTQIDPNTGLPISKEAPKEKSGK